MPVRRFVPVLDLNAPVRNEEDPKKDFVLLGRQDKFSYNIPYRLRDAPKLTTITESSLPSGERSPPPTPRERTKARVGPPPRVIFDTGAPSKSKSDLNIHTSEAATERKDRSLSFNEAPRSEYAIRANVPDAQVIEPKRAKSESFAVSNRQQSDVKTVPSSLKNSNPVAMKSDSAPVRHEHSRYARNIWPVRSEYTVQFADASAQHKSPLLQAEQIIRYDSSHILPLKSAIVHKSTEYGEQYNRNNNYSSNADFVSRQPTTFTPDPHQAKLMRRARNPQALHFPHGPYKRHQSEYRSSFSTPALNKIVDSSPTELNDRESLKFEKKPFDYEQVRPTTARDFYSEKQILPKRKYHKSAQSVYDDKESREAENNNTNNSKGVAHQDLDWFDAVLALRLEAQRNKQKGTQTNFALSHLFQLKSKQAELWNTVNNSSSLSALDLVQGKYTGRNSYQGQRHHLTRTTPVVDGALLFQHHADDDTASVSTLVASDNQATSVRSYQSSNYQDPPYTSRNDDDVESCISSLSSISSRASEVLERAKARRNCWDSETD